LALDWDAGHVHLLAATAAKGGLKIDRALAWPEEQPLSAATAAAFGQRLKDHLKEAGIAPAPLLVAIGRDRVILKEVRYPAVPPHEEPGVVRFQAVKELTDPADEVTIDYQAGNAPEPSGERKALAVAVRKDVLAAYRSLATAAGLKVVAAAPRAFGVIACLRRTANPAPDPGTAFAVLSVGEKGGEFAVARGDFLAFARPLAGPALASDAALLGEIRRNLAVYAGQAPQHPVRALYVAEGESPAISVGDRLRDTLAIPVFRFDPLAGEQPPAGSTAGSFAGIAGLLHLYGRAKSLPINFIRPREPKPPADPNRRLLGWAAVAAGVLVLIGGIAGYAVVSAKQKEVTRLAKEKADLDERLIALDQDERRIAAVDQWQNSEIVWLDELYNLTARFPDVTKLRLTELMAEPLQLPPPQPGKPIDPSKPVALVKLKGLSTDDGPLSTLMRELVKDAARVTPKQIAPNTTGTSRRQFAQQWNTSYQLAHDGPSRKPFVATPPERNRGRNRGRGGADGGDMTDFFLNGGVP
jgi:Tfp pilus assembly protein PilN